MDAWRKIESEGRPRGLQCIPLLEAGVGHVFTLRTAGGSGESRERARILAAAGQEGGLVHLPRQVHGSVVAVPSAGREGVSPPEADAVVVDRPGVAAAVATADCVGAILADADRGGFAVIHAGWRGVLAGIVEAAVARLHRECGAPPRRMLLAIGPAARRCCYEVGEDVAGPFRRLPAPGEDGAGLLGARGERITADPPAAVRLLAARAGLPADSIHDAGICTICGAGECWSFRAHGRAAGRMWAAAWLAPVSPSASP